MTARAPSATARPFVEWLDQVVAARGGSLRRLAEEAGVSPSAVSALRNGKVGRPAMETCYRFARLLKIDPAYVLGLAGYEVAEGKEVDIDDPELDLMFHHLLELTPEEREPVKEFVRYALARAAGKRSRPAADRGGRR